MQHIHIAPQSGAAVDVPSERSAPEFPMGQLHYVTAVSSLCRQAVDRDELEHCVEALCWCLAGIVVAEDPAWAVADIFQRLSWHIRSYLERNRAQQELEALKQSGGTTN